MNLAQQETMVNTSGESEKEAPHAISVDATLHPFASNSEFLRPSWLILWPIVVAKIMIASGFAARMAAM
jgi:hypothetical protein